MGREDGLIGVTCRYARCEPQANRNLVYESDMYTDLY